MFFLETMATLSNNRLVWGLAMLLMNFGIKYIHLDLGKSHERLLQNEIVKKLVILSLFFVATRDLLVSFVLTFMYVLIIDGILHDKRRYTVVVEKDQAKDKYENASSLYQKNLHKIKSVDTQDVYFVYTPQNQ